MKRAEIWTEFDMAWFLGLFKLTRRNVGAGYRSTKLNNTFIRSPDGSKLTINIVQIMLEQFALKQFAWVFNILRCVFSVEGFSMECERGACARATRSRKNTSCGLESWGPWPHTSGKRCTSFRPRELFTSSTNLPSMVFFQELHLLDPHLEARKLVNHGEPQLHICYETTIVSDGVVCLVFERVKNHPAFLADPTKRGNQVLFLRRLFSSSRRRFIPSHATHPTASQFLEQSRFGSACCALGSFLGARCMSSRWQEI